MDVELPGNGRVVAAGRDGQFAVDNPHGSGHASDGDDFFSVIAGLPFSARSRR
jgi:hypothetical protein